MSDRSKELLWEASALARLWEAWERVRDNHGGPGGDGVTVERFDLGAKGSLSRLSHALRSGGYRPAPARRVDIPRKSGGTRQLDIPAVVDRVAQCAVALTIGPVLDAEMEDSSFAYRAGRGVNQAVRRVSSLRRDGFHWVVDGDIKRYFERIPHDRLLDRVESSIGDDRLLDLIAHWLEWYGQYGRGVPQGSPLSPLLANIYLDGVDEAIATRGLRLVRYADDFLILARDERDASRALERIGVLLGEHGLELHPDKTRIRSFDEGFRFLGHLFMRSFVAKEVEWDLPEEETIALGEAAVAVEADLVDASDDRRKRSPGWRTLYVLERDRHCDAKGESIIVRDTQASGRPILAIQAARVGRIEVLAHVELSSALLALAAAHAIVIARIDGHGETLAEWVPPAALFSHGKRQLAQARHLLDPALRLDLARRLVIGRLRGQRAWLAKANAKRKDAEISAALARWRGLLNRAAVAETTQQLMGHEGAAGALYWPLLARCLAHDMRFDGKRRRQRDKASPFDIVLNLLANAVTRDVRLALMRHGLHPGMAVLHAARDDAAALAFDLVEELRAPLVEATAVALVNRQAVNKDMFDRPDRGGYYISSAAYAAVMRGYEAALDRQVTSPSRGQRVKWRTLIDDQAAALAAHFEDRAVYQPFEMKY